ncbi:hypothetical protein [uncultured Microbulbifer sp.]|uniref:hypothetical protein n=1 Tax=uncultured Microbulbifer sp. TaxID=348147 RepID=UPI00260605AB|nr:hypothetical protein [uncultured Microbulbifer sp.]
MKKLLIPLIILLLIIGYFMSRSGEHKAKEAYDSMNSPNSGQMNDNSQPAGSGSDSTTPNGTTTPPDGMGDPDAQMPQDSDQTDPTPPGGAGGSGEGSGASGPLPMPGSTGAGSPGDSDAGGPPPVPGANGQSAEMPGSGDNGQADQVIDDASKEADKAVEGAESLDSNTPNSETETDQGMESNSDEP